MHRGERIGERAVGEIGSVPVPRGDATDLVKFAAVTRRLTTEIRICMGAQPDGPTLGRYVVARVLGACASTHVRDRSGRRVRLYPDDLIAGAWSQPGPVASTARLLTAGGSIGDGQDVPGGAPEVEVVGSVTDLGGRPLSTGATARMPTRPAIPSIGTIAVVGMDGCAEDVAAAVVNGWAGTGFVVGAGRVAGEETGTHRWAMADAGAHVVADFLDFGMASTHVYPTERRAAALLAIRDALVTDGAQILVLQIDDAAREESEALLGRLASVADAAVVCARDEAEARAALARLEGLAIPIRAVSGPVADDAASGVAVATWSGMPVRTTATLSSGAAAGLLAPDGSGHAGP